MDALWIRAAIATLATIALVVAFQLLKGWRLVRRLTFLRDKRIEARAFTLCEAEFPHVSPIRVRAAYAWVQKLIAVENMPLYPDDDLCVTLEIDQGEVDGKFEACYECYGKEHDEGVAASKPLRTVKDLMAAVLASGYEFYPNKESQIAA